MRTCPVKFQLKLVRVVELIRSCSSAAGIDLLPTAVYQNDRKCILVRNGLSASAFDVQRTPFGSTGRPETPMRLSGPNIIGVDGEVLAMKGLNWFGFDVSIFSKRLVSGVMRSVALPATCFIVLL